MLEDLQSGDDIRILDSVIQLATELSLAADQLQGF